MLKNFPKNSRITITLEPYSSVMACVLTFYAALYMQANGLSAKQIGLIGTIGAATGLMLQFTAAPITNTLGRRRTLTLFSLICWSIPLLLWSMASGFAVFLAAAVFFSFSKITGVAWYCVLTEDVDNDKKSHLFGIVMIIASIGGVATVFTGPVIDKFGLVPSLRFLYAFAFVSMTLMFVVRHLLLTETHAGAALNDLHGKLTIFQSFSRYWQVVHLNLRNMEFLRLIIVFALFNFAVSMGFVQILFINNVLKLTMTELSIIPAVGAAVSFILFRYMVPRLSGRNEMQTLGLALAIFAVGTFFILLIPAKNLWLTLLASALTAAGTYLFQVFINAAMNNRMGLLHKADIWSAIQILVSLAIIPAGYVAGGAFDLNPKLPILIIGLIAAAAAVLTLLPLKMKALTIEKTGNELTETGLPDTLSTS